MKLSIRVLFVHIFLCISSVFGTLDGRPPTQYERNQLKHHEVSQPLKRKLDILFPRAFVTSLSRNTATTQLKRKGFKIIAANGSIVCTHTSLPGYIIKIPTAKDHVGRSVPNFTRIIYAKIIQLFVLKKRLPIIVPEKKAYFVDLPNLSDEGLIVVAKKVNLNQRQELNKAQRRAVEKIKKELRYQDDHGGNIIGLRGGKVAIVDTEKW